MRLIALSLVVLGTFPGGALAATSANSRTIDRGTLGGAMQIWGTPNPGDSPFGKVVITGAIGDYGKTANTEKNGKIDTDGDYIKVTLTKGTFVVDDTAIEPMFAHLKPRINMTTCTGVYELAAVPVNVSHGTGMYTGITGKGRLHFVFAAIARQYTTGAQKGQCNMSDNSVPIAQFTTVTGTLQVTFR